MYKPTTEEISEQLQLLSVHRYTLRLYLRQRAMLGVAHMPPGVLHGIAETRAFIKRIKTTLNDWNVEVDDHPDEEPDDLTGIPSGPYFPARLVHLSRLEHHDQLSGPTKVPGVLTGKRLPQLKNGSLFLNRFSIRGSIGRGGFSDAYLAWDRVRDGEVVIKLMATVDQPSFLRRYVNREVRMARELTTPIPGLVTTYEVVPFQEGVCFVQEYIPGESLHKRLQI